MIISNLLQIGKLHLVIWPSIYAWEPYLTINPYWLLNLAFRMTFRVQLHKRFHFSSRFCFLLKSFLSVRVSGKGDRIFLLVPTYFHRPHRSLTIRRVYSWRSYMPRTRINACLISHCFIFIHCRWIGDTWLWKLLLGSHFLQDTHPALGDSLYLPKLCCFLWLI